MIFEVGVKVLLLILLLRGLQTLIGFFEPVGGGVIIYDMHVVNNVCSLRPEVSEEETPHHLLLVLQRGTFEFVLPSMHGATSVYFGVVMHVNWGEFLARKVRDLITKLVVTLFDEAPLLVVEGVAYFKCHPHPSQWSDKSVGLMT